MSGGSFDYLYARESLPELLERTDSINSMSQTLRNAGQEQAASDTEALLAELAIFEEYILARADRLRGIWKAVEWTHSCDWGPESIAEEAETLASAPPFTGTVRIDTATGRIVK